MIDILGRTFDNNEKTNLISNVQQNGQATLSTIESAIRNSQFVCVGGKNASGIVVNPNQQSVEYLSPILVLFRDGRYTRYQIFPQTSSANGYILEDYPVTDSQDLRSAFCNSGSTTPPFVPPAASTSQRVLTNNTTLSVKRGSITLLSNPVTGSLTRGTSQVAITILFSIGPSFTAQNKAESQIGENNEIEFKTTTQFR